MIIRATYHYPAIFHDQDENERIKLSDTAFLDLPVFQRGDLIELYRSQPLSTGYREIGLYHPGQKQFWTYVDVKGAYIPDHEVLLCNQLCLGRRNHAAMLNIQQQTPSNKTKELGAGGAGESDLKQSYRQDSLDVLKKSAAHLALYQGLLMMSIRKPALRVAMGGEEEPNYVYLVHNNAGRKQPKLSKYECLYPVTNFNSIAQAFKRRGLPWYSDNIQLTFSRPLDEIKAILDSVSDPDMKKPATP